MPIYNNLSPIRRKSRKSMNRHDKRTKSKLIQLEISFDENQTCALCHHFFDGFCNRVQQPILDANYIKCAEFDN